MAWGSGVDFDPDITNDSEQDDSRSSPRHINRPDSPEQEVQIQQSIAVSLEIQFDRLASVPQHLGFTTNPEAVMDKKTNESRFLWSSFCADIYYPFHHKAEPLPQIRAFGGYKLPWTLFGVGSQDLASERVANYALRILKYIAKEIGIPQSLILAHDLEKIIAGKRGRSS